MKRIDKQPIKRTVEERKADRKTYMQDYYQKNKEHLMQLKKVWLANNRESVNAFNRNWQKEQRIKDPMFDRNHNLKKTYGITITDYDNMLANQHNKCAICQTHISDLQQVLEVDHSHLSGKVRGLLCHKCNSLLGEANIGKFKETDELYTAALGYININFN